MAQITITDIVDGTGADGDDINSRIGTIVTEINGRLNADNIQNGAIVTSKLVDNAVTKIKLERSHYLALYFSTGGTGGGQVVANNQTALLLDTIDTAHSFGITATTGPTGFIQIARDGVYAINAHMSVSDGSTNAFILWMFLSFDNGTTYVGYRHIHQPISAVDGYPGVNYSWNHWLPAGTRIRFEVFSLTNIRLASFNTDQNSRLYSGPKVSVSEIR